MHAVDPEQIAANRKLLTADQIVQEVKLLGDATNCAQYVTLSGGDPVMWMAAAVVSQLKAAGYKIAVETQGQSYKTWLEACNSITVSPKPPSSGMADKASHAVLQEYIGRLNGPAQRLAFKVVVFTEDDFDWAIALHHKFPDVPFFLSVGTPVPSEEELEDQHFDPTRDVLERYDEVIRWAVGKKMAGDIRILAQTHVLLWGHSKGV